jgi:hypothetical protein
MNAHNEGNVPKNWNFPKFHALQHAFDDVKSKGVTLNYNTKPNKKMHGPLKKAYILHTNFKGATEQVLIVYYTIENEILMHLPHRF